MIKDKIRLYRILLDVKENKKSPEQAQLEIIEMTGENPIKDSGDFRDSKNYESQDEYYGRIR